MNSIYYGHTVLIFNRNRLINSENIIIVALPKSLQSFIYGNYGNKILNDILYKYANMLSYCTVQTLRVYSPFE